MTRSPAIDRRRRTLRPKGAVNVISPCSHLVLIKLSIVALSIFAIAFSFLDAPTNYDLTLLDSFNDPTTTTTDNDTTRDQIRGLEDNAAVSAPKLLAAEVAATTLSTLTPPAITLSTLMSPATELAPPNVIAYAVSFIKCADKQTSTAGLVDASLILRHSIHKLSSRNPSSGSNYDYKMYAIVHKGAENCSSKLKDMGFTTIVVDPPIDKSEIKGEYLKKKIQREWCCGADEFVKLFAYTLPHEIIVHVDIDFAFYKPMDHLFDAIRYDKDSPKGQAARANLELERPEERNSLPDIIGSFITRDWPQVAPKKFPPAYQAGFLVARRDPKVMEDMIEIVREGNYTSGWGLDSGWSNSGHGGYVGAMAMQGLVAYYYDHVNTNNAVELNQCRHNHMGMDTKFRNHPNYSPRYVQKELLGGCRNTLDYCEDCMFTEFDKIYSVHYTMCRKPWQCISESKVGKPLAEQKQHYFGSSVDQTHCLEVVRHWHELRVDFETQLRGLTQDETILQGQKGNYRADIFFGHCDNEGNSGYIDIHGTDEAFARVDELYKVP